MKYKTGDYVYYVENNIISRGIITWISDFTKEIALYDFKDLDQNIKRFGLNDETLLFQGFIKKPGYLTHEIN